MVPGKEFLVAAKSAGPRRPGQGPVCVVHCRVLSAQDGAWRAVVVERFVQRTEGMGRDTPGGDNHIVVSQMRAREGTLACVPTRLGCDKGRV